MNLNKKIVIFGGSFNPPGVHHREIAIALANQFDLVVVLPCGMRPDKASSLQITDQHRRAMVQQTFKNLDKVEVSFIDLEHGEYTRTYKLDKILQEIYCADLWYAVGTDLIQGGATGDSEIQSKWFHGPELWTNLNYAVITRKDMPASPCDFPPKNTLVQFDALGSSSEIRKRFNQNKSIKDLVLPEIEQYIKSHNLYNNK